MFTLATKTHTKFQTDFHCLIIILVNIHWMLACWAIQCNEIPSILRINYLQWINNPDNSIRNNFISTSGSLGLSLSLPRSLFLSSRGNCDTSTMANYTCSFCEPYTIYLTNGIFHQQLLLAIKQNNNNNNSKHSQEWHKHKQCIWIARLLLNQTGEEKKTKVLTLEWICFNWIRCLWLANWTEFCASSSIYSVYLKKGCLFFSRLFRYSVCVH